MKFLLSIAFVLGSSIALADVSYVCKSESKTDDNIHLNFSTKAPGTVGFARVKVSGEEVTTGKLSCSEKPASLFNCFIVSASKRSELSIQGLYTNGENLSLIENSHKYKCEAKTVVNLNAVKLSH